MPLLYRWMVWTQKSFHLLPLFISYRSWGEKLIKYQANSSCVIMSVILMTTLFYKALILQGEIWCWSLKRTVTNVSTTSTVVIFTNLKENFKCSKWRSKFQSRFFFPSGEKNKFHWSPKWCKEPWYAFYLVKIDTALKDVNSWLL